MRYAPLDSFVMRIQIIFKRNKAGFYALREFCQGMSYIPHRFLLLADERLPFPALSLVVFQDLGSLTFLKFLLTFVKLPKSPSENDDNKEEKGHDGPFSPVDFWHVIRDG